MAQLLVIKQIFELYSHKRKIPRNSMDNTPIDEDMILKTDMDFSVMGNFIISKN